MGRKTDLQLTDTKTTSAGVALRNYRAAGKLPDSTNDGNGIATGQPLQPHLVSVRGDRLRHTRRRDAPAVLKDRIRPASAVVAHGPHATRSLPACDPESPANVHGLRDRHAGN